METVNVHQLKLSATGTGGAREEIVISNRGVPVAKLVPLQPARARCASLGLDRERFTVPDDFDAPSHDLLVAFGAVG